MTGPQIVPHPMRNYSTAAEHGNVVPAPFGQGEQHPLKRAYLSNWMLVKRARFNASKRLERKQSAGTVTLAIVALYGGLISVFNLMFKQRVGGDTRDILEYVAVVSSWLTLIIGLTETMKGHGANARELHDCARDVNNLQKQLSITPVRDEQMLQSFLARYREIIERCRPNHDNVDYRLAELDLTRGERERLLLTETWDERAHARQLLWAKICYHTSTYWFYLVIWFAPPLVGLVLWWILPPSVVGG